MNYERSKAKDALAWTILHSGWLVAKTAITTGAVAGGFIDKAAARQLSKMLSKMVPHMKADAWRHYECTGSIWEMVQIAAGSSELYTWDEMKSDASALKFELQDSVSMLFNGGLNSTNVEIIRNGTKDHGDVSFTKMNGKPCLIINGLVLFMNDIIQYGDYSENGKTYLEVSSKCNRVLIEMCEIKREKWKETLQSIKQDE